MEHTSYIIACEMKVTYLLWWPREGPCLWRDPLRG